MGSLVGLAPQTKLQAPQIEIWNTLNQWSFCQILECQAPLRKRNPPIEDFLVTVLYQYLAKSDNPRWIWNWGKYRHWVEKSGICVTCYVIPNAGKRASSIWNDYETLMMSEKSMKET